MSGRIRTESATSASPTTVEDTAASRRRAFYERLLKDPWHKALLMFLSLVLLFGSQVRELFVPASGDLAVDICFTIVWVLFVIDIAMRCVAEDMYFRKWRGSFLFWCDTISVLTLLYDISYINVYDFAEVNYSIELREWGISKFGFEGINSGRPIEFDATLLLTVFQTARVARFIRSSRAVKISSHINWYWLCQLGSRKKRKKQPSISWSMLGMLSTVNESSITTAKPPRSWNSFFFRKTTLEHDIRRHFAAVRIQRAWRHHRGGGDTNQDHVTSSSAAAGGGVMATSSTKRATTPGLETSSARPPPLPTSSSRRRRNNESQVGSARRELTGQRVAIGIIVALFLTVIFTYVEQDTTRAATMMVLHKQTANDLYIDRALQAARSSSVPDLMSYQLADGSIREFDVVEAGVAPDGLRPRERIRVTIRGVDNQTTVGVFSYRNERREEAFVSVISTIFILFVWFFGVTAFAGPVMVLVVVPIERMVRLLDMLMVDPLGYQSTFGYKRFVDEENELTKNTRWTKEILKGMETSFLMSTILRIGSLMKVGFGSAGVEIIRNNLDNTAHNQRDTRILSSQGSTVSCIFLFCDIRNFTDATECLQEEVFVFTNRIAAVVHSNCHAYGGSANKNIGDAFLLSWLLDEYVAAKDGVSPHDRFTRHNKMHEGFTAKSNQADKALLSVAKICMALHYDDYYIEAMTDAARQALVTKLKNRKGPVVQMGFGLHAGRAVQGAIGSQRKIDATYVSEAVERAEFLESSTKKYGLKMLMSDSFYRLLHPSNRRRCRNVDHILIREEDEDDDVYSSDGILELYTFDMDIDALWTNEKKITSKSDSGRESDTASDTGSKRGGLGMLPRSRRISVRKNISKDLTEERMSESGFLPMGATSQPETGADTVGGRSGKLVLPTGPALYNSNVWTSEDMRKIRQLYSDGLFFQNFSSGLQSFYSKDWEHAKQCFAVILERFEDGPSRYFMNQIEKRNGRPPANFLGYGTA